MRAVSVAGFGRPPVLADLAEPPLAADGAVIDVRATGLCRSDWHGWMGHDPTMSAPYVPGHEFAGTIAAVGDRVTKWRIGDRVTVPFVCACGECEQCAEGAGQVCPNQEQPGFTYDGSFAERVAVPHAEVNLVRLPDSLGFAEAAALGCRFATAYHALTARGRVREGEWVAVHGCGGVGLSAVMTARALGARVIGVDPSPRARAAAEELGALTVEGGTDGEAVGARVRELTNGGAHVSIDAFGGAATMLASVLSLRPRGRHVQVGLMVDGDTSAPVPMGRVLGQELEILGSHGMPAHEYPAMLERVASGQLDLRSLVTSRIGLDDIPGALMALDRPGAGGVTVAELG